MEITVQFTNSEIAFAVSECFKELSARFQVQIIDKIQENSEQNFEQEITISDKDLLIIYAKVSRVPEGVTGKNNSNLKAKLLPIIISEVQSGNKEAIELVNKISEIDNKNNYEKEMKIRYSLEMIKKIYNENCFKKN